MKWKTCLLKKYVNKTIGEVVQTDALGNVIKETAELFTTRARFSPYCDIKEGLDGRTITSDEQYFTLPMRASNYPQIDIVVVDNIEYEVLEIIDLEPRWTVLRCKVYEH